MSTDVPFYPLGHEPAEAERLEVQAEWLCEPRLENACRTAKRVLEIGCGTGANLRRLCASFPGLEATGIDFAEKAIQEARQRHCGGKITYEVMDATALEFPDRHFDLVFGRLVLWSIGPHWRQALVESARVLRSGGTLYALEPDDGFVTFSPPLPAAEAFIARWDEAAMAAGLDPFIGRKIAGELVRTGWEDVQVSFHAEVATGRDEARSTAIRDNLRHFYFGASASRFGLDNDAHRAQAERELNDATADSLVMDGFFVVTGRR